MSIAGHTVGPTSATSTWHPAGSGTRTSVQDKINLFETNPATAGGTKTGNLATSRHFRRWSSSATLNFAIDNEAPSISIANRDPRSPGPRPHLRTFSVEDCSQEEQREMMLQARRAEMFASSRNQELNRRLQMKADELERMFAEHKRRIYGDDLSTESKPAAADEEKTEGRKDVARGSLYERYMLKRDARRWGEWGRNRELKEARARAMWEDVEKSRAELMAWHHRRQDAASVDVRLAARPSARNKDQNPVSSEFADEEEDKQSSDDGSLKSVNSKLQTSRSMSSSTSRVSGPALSRPSSQLPSSRSLRGSVPGKANAHAQPSSMTRSKSTNAGVNYLKEEKPPRSASMRKSSVTPLTQLKTTKDHSGPRPFLKKGSGAGLSKLRTSISSELNDQQPDSPGPSLKGYVYNQTTCPQETLDDCNSPCGSTSSWFSQDGTRVRKKWGSVQVPVLVPDGSHQPKGLKRFLHFGKKSRGLDGKVADWVSVSAVSGADYDMERDMVSEQITSSSMGTSVFFQSLSYS